jgi:hypothetical protein
MKSIVGYLNCGRFLSSSNRKEVYFIVSTFSDIYNIIIPMFQEYPLLGAKQQDYIYFVKVAELIKSKAHLTKEGLAEINLIKDNMRSRIKKPAAYLEY